MATEHDDIQSAIEKRTRFARRMRGDDSPEQRLARFAALQRRSFELLRASPEGYRHFLRRNIHSRRVEEC